MTGKNLASWVMACLLAVLLAPTAHAQAHTTTSASTTTKPKPNPTPDHGSFLELDLKASKLKAVQVSQSPPFNGSFPATCPAIGPPAFTYNVDLEDVPVNDDTQYFDKIHPVPVLEITHHRVTLTSTYNGNKLIQRQDWTRIKENDNGIDDLTGVRHYIGNFLEETQIPNGGSPVVTAESQGVMTVREALGFSTGPLAGVANRVDVVQFIGPQASWLEPFEVNDARACAFLSDGMVRPVNVFYDDQCHANGNQTITYNGVSFTGNIVGCKQTTWP